MTEEAVSHLTATRKKPENWSDRSYYLAMHDGVRLALSLYFPDHIPPANPAPVLLVQTRYGRAQTSWRGTGNPRSIDPWLNAGYVVVIVDVRGTTSSFGSRDCELGPSEQHDMEGIIAHLANQAWSNGKVIATGVSYTANTADMATTRHAPALVAAIPRATDFDFWELFWPGGIPNDSMFLDWTTAVYEMDFGRPTAPGESSQQLEQNDLDGRLRAGDCAKLFPMLQPVDEDPDYKLLQEALNSREKERRHWNAGDYANVFFRDDRGLNDHSFFDSCAGGHLEAVLREKKPVQYWGSWLDANTADEALNRYRSTQEIPSVVIITANDHGGGVGADPFFPERLDPLPSMEEQHGQRLAFANEVISGSLPARTIRYYVLGAGMFRETSVWPPNGVEQVRFALDRGSQLTWGTPEPGLDSHEVDFTATTGKENRWYQFTRPAYKDRRTEDRKLQTYDSLPMTEDTELVGWPVVTLRMCAQTSDPAVFAYIEDVAPDGRVTYITEGQLRAVNRKLADPAKLPYDPGPAPHSFNRIDALPVVPGESFTMTFKLYATAALIKKGHRIRLAVAGADLDTFRRMSNGHAEQFGIYRGGAEPSIVELPLRRWL